MQFWYRIFQHRPAVRGVHPLPPPLPRFAPNTLLWQIIATPFTTLLTNFIFVHHAHGSTFIRCLHYTLCWRIPFVKKDWKWNRTSCINSFQIENRSESYETKSENGIFARYVMSPFHPNSDIKGTNKCKAQWTFLHSFQLVWKGIYCDQYLICYYWYGNTLCCCKSMAYGYSFPKRNSFHECKNKGSFQSLKRCLSLVIAMNDWTKLWACLVNDMSCFLKKILFTWIFAFFPREQLIGKCTPCGYLYILSFFLFHMVNSASHTNVYINGNKRQIPDSRKWNLTRKWLCFEK